MMSRSKQSRGEKQKVKFLVSLVMVIMTYISFSGHVLQKLEFYYFDAVLGNIKTHTRLYDVLLMVVWGIILGLSAIDKKKLKKVAVSILVMLVIRTTIILAMLGKIMVITDLLSLGFTSIAWRLVICVGSATAVRVIFKKHPQNQWVFSPVIMMSFLASLNAFDSNLVSAGLAKFHSLLNGSTIERLKDFRQVLPNILSIWWLFAAYLLVSFIICYFIFGKAKISLLGIVSVFNVYASYALIRYMSSAEGVYPDYLMYWVNIFLMSFIFLAIYQILGKIVLANMVFVVFSSVYAIANFLKIKYRQEPIIPADLKEIKNAVEIVKMIPYQVVILTLVGLIAIIAVYILVLRKKESKTRLKLYQRVVVLIVSIASFILISFSFANSKLEDEPVLNQLIVKLFSYQNIDYQGVLPVSRINGALVTFAQMAVQRQMTEPDGYSKAKMLEIYKKYENEANQLNQTRQNNFSDSSVVFILSESFSDPTRIPGLTLSEDPIPYIRQLKEETTSGLMFSLGYGGGTANIEYEALSSFPMTNYNGSLTTPFSQLVPVLDYFPNITTSFKEKSGIHLFSLDLYNREQVWRDIIKFNPVIVGEDGGRIGNSPYVSDDATYDAILNQLKDPSQEGGQYIHAVTIQNHSAYTEGYYNNEIKASSKTLKKDSLKSIETYSQGLKYTDGATKRFIDEINQLDKDVTVVFYGDHLPGIYSYKDGKSIIDKNFALGHLTDYFIYNNKNNQKLDYPVVAPYEFTSLAMTQTNAKVTPFYALMTQVQNELPALEINRYIDNARHSGTLMNLSATQRNLLEDVKMVQYDIYSNQNYLGRSFYQKE